MTKRKEIEMQDGVQDRIKMFSDNLQQLYVDHYAAMGYTPLGLSAPLVKVMLGRKFCKIALQENNGSQSVYCFIDLSNGDILKASGWNAPAKGKRGSIWNADCDVGPNKPANIHGGGLYLFR